MLRRRGCLVFCLLAIWLISSFAFSAAFSPANAFQAPPQDKNKESQLQAQPEKIIPSPKNIKERTAIYVFLGWMWASILVLIYFLRLKIKESDRLFWLKFFPEDKE